MYYNRLNEYLKGRFGCKVYKLSLVGCKSCPNRDGTVGSRGCIFCSDCGAGEFAQPTADSIYSQIEAAKNQVAKKVKSAEKVRYIAYFQSFTNTYAPIEQLSEMFLAAISHPDIAVLSIATRPDCLDDGVLDLIGRLNKIKPVWVELGLQTIHDESADFIRRGYPLEAYNRAAKALRKMGITVIAHMIIGLPNESEQMIYQTAEHIGNTADGIKLHMLYVQSGTDLAELYQSGNIPLFEMDDYIRVLGGCIERLPKSTVVHRITGDGDKKSLIAPMWTANKRRVLNAINSQFIRLNITQGRLAEKD